MFTPSHSMHAARPAFRAGRGFTIVEILVSTLVLVLLLGLLIVGISHARKFARGSAQSISVSALKTACNTFQQTFGFPPPLCREAAQYPAWAAAKDLYEFAPGGESKIAVYDVADTKNGAAYLKFLRRADEPTIPGGWGGTTPEAKRYYDARFSAVTPTVYLVGIAEKALTRGPDLPIDGVKGPGFMRPRTDGTFEVPESIKVKPISGGGVSTASARVGDSFGPFIDVGKGQMKLVRVGDTQMLQDDRGMSYRYYRWEKGDADGKVKSRKDLNIPWILVDRFTPVGERDLDIDDPKRSADAALNSATWAIVAAGPDGLFGDEPWPEIKQRMTGAGGFAEHVARRKAIDDNVVEVGS